jgi:hypothetical protein
VNTEITRAENRYKQMRMKTKPFILFILVCFAIVIGHACSKDESTQNWPEGQFNQPAMQKLSGFPEQRAELLVNATMSLEEFISFSTDSAWHLSDGDKSRLRELRNGVSFPASSTVIQKVIALEDVALYMNNTYGGTVGGFVSSAGDVKSLKTLSDVYYGMRLDYSGTKFSPDGGGYAVLRFTSNVTGNLSIPYCIEMGGTRTHAWPNTGGGFTASSLGDGGFPEYTFDSYYEPNQGGELYEVTPAGNEILRAQFIGTGWVTTEPELKNARDAEIYTRVENPIRNGIYARAQGGAIYPVIALPGGRWKIQGDKATSFTPIDALVSISTFADYKGATFQIRGCDGENYYLTSKDPMTRFNLSLDVIEKGLFGITVPIPAVNKVWEIVSDGGGFYSNRQSTMPN